MTDLFLDLFNMSVTASYLVLAVIVARLLLKKAPKWINCLLWALVAIRLVCPFSFESALSLIPSSQTISVNTESVGRPFTIQTGVPVVDTGINNYMGDRYYEGVTVPTNTFANFTTVLSVIWLVGLIAILIYGLISYIRLRKKVGISLLVKERIYYCDNIATPFILGIIKPEIYVPSGITEEQLDYIVMHEKAHLKRKDHLWKPLGFVLLSVYWFNPVMWVAYVLLCRDIESACDEKVIKNMNNTEKKSYSETLLSCSVQKRMVMACPVAFGEVGVKQRIKSVLNYKKPAFWVVILAVVLFVAVAVCFISNPVNDKVNKILNEDGYEVISLNEKNISFCFNSDIITGEMFKDGVYKVKGRDILNDCVMFNVKKVQSNDSEFIFTFDVTYENVLDEGTIYVLDAPQFDGGLDLGDEIKVSDPFGDIIADTPGSYTSYCHSKGPSTEFCFSVPKVWFENKADNKIVVDLEVLEIVYEKRKSSSSLGIIGGADGPTAIIVGNGNSEKELKKLQDKYPHFFGLDTQEGVTVYVTKTSRDNYKCYVSSNKNPTFPPDILNFDEFSSIGEMRTILSVYALESKNVTVKPFQHMLSSYLWDEAEVSTTNLYLLLGFETYGANTGRMHKVYDEYYYAVIDAESELVEYGLYYLSDKESGKYILVDKIGSIKPYFVVFEDALFYTSEYKLKSVDTDGTNAVTVYGAENYNSKLDYAIETIEIAKDGYIYCRGDRWGKTPETKNDRETVYLSIRILDGFFEEISENDIPADMTFYDDVLSNIKATLNTGYENILVKGFRVKYNAKGKLDSAIFRVWIYKNTVSNEDFWTEGNVIVTFDGKAFFNVINEEIVLLSEYNPKNNGSLLTIDKIMPKIKLAVTESASFESKDLLKYYILTFEEEKYVEYVADKSSKAEYLIEVNGSFKEIKKPKELTSETYHVPNKIYFTLVPHYDKALTDDFIFEEDENLVSKDYTVMLFEKDSGEADKKQGETDFQKVITPTTKPYVDFFTPSGERVIE